MYRGVDKLKRLVFVIVVLLLGVPPLYADNHIDQYMEKARKAQKMGQFGQAKRWLHRVLYMNEAEHEARIQLAELYIAAKQYPEAQKLMDEGLTLDAESVEFWITSGLVHRELNQLGLAKEAYATAVALAPQNEVVLQKASGFYRFIGDMIKSRALALQRKQLLGDENG